jgi:GntR family transcriptional repressor for pyruvate dehydrogenase complex
METPMELPLRAMAGDERRRARLPRMAEVVADSLRTQILDGEIDVVPPLDALVRQYDVGPPAAREALRILETEGLITVRRGNVGGADVHLPTNEHVAYSLSLVLQSTTTPLADVGAALRRLEPVCASMCAERDDRAATLVPALRELNERQESAMGDRRATWEITDAFHSVLVRECGNQTLVQVVGALERVWGSHAESVLLADDVEPAPERLWKAALKEHRQIADAVEKGDADRAALLTRRHLVGSHAYMSSVDDHRMISASVVQRSL